MKIALLCPVRERMELNIRLERSLVDTTIDSNNVTLFYGVDHDDVQTMDSLQKLSVKSPVMKVVKYPPVDQYMGVGWLWNHMAMNLVPKDYDILAMIGNDMIFKTIGWDVKVIQHFHNISKDGLKMVHCDDGFQHGRIAVNSFIHRKYIEYTGYYVREEFKVDWIDTWLHEVFKGIGRCVYLPDVLIEHNHWSIGKMNKDNVVNRMRDNENGRSEQLYKDMTSIRYNEIRMLKSKLCV